MIFGGILAVLEVVLDVLVAGLCGAMEWMRMRMGKVLLLPLLHYAQVLSIYGELLV